MRSASPMPKLFLLLNYMRHILEYILMIKRGVMSKAKRNAKADRLKENDSLNLHPERVLAKHFQHSAFFDPHDLVQVKYEMLREVSHEGASKVHAAASYGISRQAFYQALNAFTLGGIAGLLPRQRGPKGAHKLSGEVMAFIAQRQAQDPGLHARALAEALREELHLVVHPRSIERALARKKKR
jgi:transposase